MEQNLEEIMKKSKSRDETTQVKEKGMNIDLVNITAQEDAKPVKVKTYLNVTIQIKNISSKDQTIN